VALYWVDDRPGIPRRRESPWKAWSALRSDFKRYLVPAGILSLAHFSFAFRLLRAHTVGIAVRDIALPYALCNPTFVASAPLIGRIGDPWGRGRIITAGYLTYLTISLGFARAAAKWQIVVLFVLYGVFYTIDKAQSKAFIADVEPERCASAIGVYNSVTGLTYVAASVVAGVLWAINPAGAFLLAGGVSAVAMGRSPSCVPIGVTHQQSLRNKSACVPGRPPEIPTLGDQDRLVPEMRAQSR
jgi:MFS family permease